MAPDEVHRLEEDADPGCPAPCWGLTTPPLTGVPVCLPRGAWGPAAAHVCVQGPSSGKSLAPESGAWCHSLASHGHLQGRASDLSLLLQWWSASRDRSEQARIVHQPFKVGLG